MPANIHIRHNFGQAYDCLVVGSWYIELLQGRPLNILGLLRG